MKKHTEKTNTIAKSKTRRVLMLIAAMFTAIAVAVGCALFFGTSTPVSVDDVTAGEVSASTAYTGRTGDLTAPAAIKNGDTLTYDYTGGVQYIRLPKGIYTLQVWGAEGGGKRLSNISDHGKGGSGGYSTGRYEITAAYKDLYIGVGGYGRWSTSGNAAGGWNGGGQGYSCGAGEPGGGGGGATHIAIDNNRGELRNYNNYRAEVLIVAGAGGGGGEDASDAYGHGGGTSGVNGAGSTYNGTQTAAGSGGGFGYGGGTGVGDGGGGGGGWFGGGTLYRTSSGQDTQGGGGGSGYVNTSLLTSASTVAGGASATAAGGTTSGTGKLGHGKVVITVVLVNQPPVSNTDATSGNNIVSAAANYSRGTERNIDIPAYRIGQDADYSNITNGSVNGVYYTAGTATNLDAAPGANAGVFLDANCTQLATDYLSWTFPDSQTLRITEIKKYPRSGVDNCTQNGQLTLYTRVRDNFGSATTRGHNVLPFYFTVKENTISAKTGDTVTFTKGTGSTAYEYRYGNPTHTGTEDASRLFDFMNTPNSIYNPSGTSTSRTVFLPKPIAPTDTNGYTIYARDLFDDLDAGANDSSGYDLIAIKSVAPLADYTSYSKYYNITYTPDANYAAGLAPSFTIRPTGVRPEGAVYICATITAQASERVTKAAVGNTNTQITLVFRISNTRPYLASSTALAGINTSITEQLVTLKLGSDNTATKTVNISDLVYDIDDSSLTATFAQTTSDVKVPTNEYIQVDMANVAVPLSDTRGANTGLGHSNYYNKTEINTTTGSLSSQTGEGTTATGFRQGALALAGSTGASQANVTYSFVNERTISFTARAATQNMYKTAEGNRDDDRLGHFYILVRVIDPSDVADTGIWYPIAIIVESSAPTEPTTVANFDIQFEHFEGGERVSPASNGSDASQGEENGVVISPISYTDESGELRALGWTTSDGLNSLPVKPFVVDPDTFLIGSSYNDFALLDIDKHNSDDASLWTFGEAYESNEFFTVTPIQLFANKAAFTSVPMTEAELAAFGVTPLEGSITMYKYYGLQIKPLRSTNGEYFQRDINLIDSHGIRGTVRICINIANRSVQHRRSGYPTNEITSSYPVNPITHSQTVKGAVANNTLIGAVVVNYQIERNDLIQITPYDFAYDLDVDYDNSHINSNGTLNSNPSDTGFAAAANHILREYNIPHTTSVSSPADAASSVKSQALSFANTANIISNGQQYSNFIDLTVSDSVTVGNKTYDIPVINITGVSRTTSAIVQIRFDITDGYSSIDCIVVITVNNSAPTLNTNEVFTLTTEVGNANIPTSVMRTATELAADKDIGDTPTFRTDSVRVVAYDPNTTDDTVTDEKLRHYFTGLDYDSETGTYVGTNSADAQYKLADYVSAILSKNNSGFDVVYVRALSSTQLFDKVIYVEFGVQDGFRAQPQRSTLHVPVDVVNSTPTVVTDNLKQSGSDYSWIISYEDIAEIKIARYIFNCKELAEKAPVSAADSNKIYLFNDTDEQQNVLLKPGVWNNESNLTSGIIGKKPSGKITENDFVGAAFPVIIAPTYTDNGYTYLNVSIVYFEKNSKGNFSEIKNLTQEKAQNCQYWAIRITDTYSGSSAAQKTQIAIAVKDDHHGSQVYSSDKTSSVTGKTDVTVLNFYYEYKKPGVTAMHSYYRTDGNAEAATVINEAQGIYAVDIDSLGSDAGQNGYQIIGSKPADQDGLKDATFADNFKYQYFEKRYSTGTGDNANVVVTSKYYPSQSNAFYYSPIEISGSTSTSGNNNQAVVVPMSYIAMPSSVGKGGTESGIHVTLANATSGTATSNTMPLLDSDYLNWGSASNQNNYPYIFANLTLTDGKKTWTGWGGTNGIDKNDYISIEYTSNANYIGQEQTAQQKGYRNTHRFALEQSEQSGLQLVSINTIDPTSHSSIYREDKYGFTFAKKAGGKRLTNTLKLTLAVKTTNAGEDSVVEYVDVDIKLNNSKPTVEGVQETARLSVTMTTSDTAGQTVALNKRNPSEQTQGIGTYNLYYSDPDSTDTMKFLMSSANGTMSAAEYSYVRMDTNINTSENSYNAYKEGLTAENKNPNVGYERFFTVSPATGASATLQFTPVAKTQINIPAKTADQTAEQYAALKQAYLTANHLKEEVNASGVATGRYYYPFKILFYDDIDGSAFTAGSWGLAIINVYINNDPIKVVSSLKTSTSGYKHDVATYSDPRYKNKPNYKFSISKNIAFYVDVSSLLVDNDIVLSGSSFAVSDDDAWINLGKDENGQDLEGEAIYTSGQLYKDYFVMPIANTCTYISPAPTDQQPVPTLPISIDNADGESGMPKTALRFSASAAFKEPVDIMYTFRDSVGSEAVIIFSVSYNNEAPTLNEYTFGGGETLDIVMKTGDSFTVHAADYNTFAADSRGGFNSTAEAVNLASNTYPRDSAETQRGDFKLLTANNYDSERGNIRGSLGSLVLGSDDAASTLRFREFVTCTNNAQDSFTFAYANRARAEESTARSPMSITITANGVVTTRMSFVLFDSANKDVTVNLNITVLSSAPRVKTGADTNEDRIPANLGIRPVTGENNTFAISMNYGDRKELTLRSFMKDADEGDASAFTVFRNNDNSYFDVENPDGVSAVTVARGAIYSDETIVINARDFIPTSGQTVRVSFRVADAHGAVSETVRFVITIAPRNVTSVASALNTAKSVAIKSYADYVEDGEAVVLDLVQANGTVFSDSDADAPSANYDVKIYALLNPTSFLPLQSPSSEGFNAENCLLWSKTGTTTAPYPTYNEVFNYVSGFFTMTIADDGKSISFIPNSATIARESGGSLTAIRLYVVINKRYRNENNYTMQDCPAYLNVTVANSALVAVENSPFNSGYPMIPVEVNEETEYRMRESSFLEFSGTAGDSLTWNLYNLQDRELGLFYDYDLINNPASTTEGVVGGLETINYIRSSLEGVPESDKAQNKGDPVSVSLSGDGKSVKITINRKIYAGQPPAGGFTESYTKVYVDIYCADTLGMRAGSGNNNNNIVTTRITVYVENDPPKLKTVTDESKGYTVSYSVDDGYVLEGKIENGQSITVNIADIIADADINMDQYRLLFTGSDDSLMTSGGSRLLNEADGRGYIANTKGNLFSVSLSEPSNDYGITSLKSITFTCVSTARGEVGTCQLQFRDSVASSRTAVLHVRLTVDNIKPALKEGANTNITMMGVDEHADIDAVMSKSRTFSILDYISDANGDAYDATVSEGHSTPTFVFIDEITVYTTEDLANAPSLYGPGLQIEDIDDETGGATIVTVNSGVSVDWSEAEESHTRFHQHFTVSPKAGVYGTQKVLLTVIDSGYADGSSAGVNDGKSFDLLLTVTIANPLTNVPEVLENKTIAFGVTGSVTADSLLGADNAVGYEIKNIVEDGTANNLTIVPPAEDGSTGWRIFAKTENTTSTVTVTFTAGGVEITRTLPITVAINHAPDYKTNNDGPVTSYSYTLSRLTDTNGKTLIVYPEDWFEDTDPEDVMSFVGPVTSSQSVKVEAILDYDADGRAFILLKFNRRGATDITFNVTDLSGRLYQKTITVDCTDAPELSWWENVVSLIESNWMWFWIIVGGVALFIILLIIILVVVHKKRKIRREIEALLNSETELEEEMMRLSAGGGMPYQSFGYLPPTQTVGNPGLMLDGSANNPTPNSLQLNAGAGVPPQTGTSQIIPPQGMQGGAQQPNQAQRPNTGADGFDPNDF